MSSVSMIGGRAARFDAGLAAVHGDWRQAATQRLVVTFIALGVVLRLTRYLLGFPLWGDESMVAVNFLDRGYLDLIQPLEHWQICPLLFLWVELAVVKTLGFSELSLRLFPTLCSVASLFVFSDLARRTLSGAPRVLAVAVFAVSYYPIRHGAEVKPYACDLLASLVLLTLAVAWLNRPQRTRCLWGLAAAVPFCLGFSLPVVFIAGAVSLALLPQVVKNRKVWLAYASYNAALLIGFAALFLVFTGPHLRASVEGHIHNHWTDAFPPLAEPWKLPLWLLEMNTGRMFAYPAGGPRGASALTTLCVLVALVGFWRSGRRSLALLCAAPFALTLVAAALHKYPYGGAARTTLYLAPIICLLTGAGGAALLSWRVPQPAPRRALALAVLLLIGVGQIARDMSRPYKTEFDARRRGFSQWFWTDQAYDAELVCATTDLKLGFHRGLAQTPSLRCDQRIYSPRHRRREPPRWDRVSAERRCAASSFPSKRRRPIRPACKPGSTTCKLATVSSLGRRSA